MGSSLTLQQKLNYFLGRMYCGAILEQKDLLFIQVSLSSCLGVSNLNITSEHFSSSQFIRSVVSDSATP